MRQEGKWQRRGIPRSWGRAGLGEGARQGSRFGGDPPPALFDFALPLSADVRVEAAVCGGAVSHLEGGAFDSGSRGGGVGPEHATEGC